MGFPTFSILTFLRIQGASGLKDWTEDSVCTCGWTGLLKAMLVQAKRKEIPDYAKDQNDDNEYKTTVQHSNFLGFRRFFLAVCARDSSLCARVTLGGKNDAKLCLCVLVTPECVRG